MKHLASVVSLIFLPKIVLLFDLSLCIVKISRAYTKERYNFSKILVSIACPGARPALEPNQSGRRPGARPVLEL